MKKYFAPSFEKIAFPALDLLTESEGGSLIERPNVQGPNEIPGVPLI